MITLFCIYPKGLNVGNEAIQFALRHLLHKAFGRVVNIVPYAATSIYESQAKAGLTAKTIYEINRYGDGLIIGGGNLYENGELLMSTNALKALEPPAMLFSLSRGGVYNRKLNLVDRTDVMPNHSIKSLHDQAKYSLARDTATYDHLQSIGCSQSVLAGCPTIKLNWTKNQLPTLPSGEDPGTLISVRNPDLMNVPRSLQARVQKDIEHTIDLLRKKGKKRIRLLCHDLRDIDFASSFQDIKQVDYVYTDDVRWFLALLNAADLVVSYRLHATLPSLSFGTPAINISYDERSASLLDFMGLSSWDIEMIAEQNVVNAIEERLDRLDELNNLCKDLQSKWDDIWQLQLNQVTSFADDVKSYARF